MAVKPETPSQFQSPSRLWAEQLALGLALLVGLLIFMAIFHQAMLQSGAAVLGPNYLPVYGLASVVGIVAQIVIHELGSICTLWWMRVPVRFRFFGFGATATASLEHSPRNVWTQAVVGLAGPFCGTLLSVAFAGMYQYTAAHDASPAPVGEPFLLGMACVGYFYNLFTLIPILDLEGGWIAPAIAPQAWLVGLIAAGIELTNVFNLVLLCVVSFAIPRFVLLLLGRAPRTDNACTVWQRVVIGLGYFILVLGLTWFSSTTFDILPQLIRSANAD